MSEGSVRVWIQKPWWKLRVRDGKKIAIQIPPNDRELWLMTKLDKKMPYVAKYAPGQIPDWAEKLYSLGLLVGCEDRKQTTQDDVRGGGYWFTFKVPKSFFKNEGVWKEIKQIPE